LDDSLDGSALLLSGNRCSKQHANEPQPTEALHTFNLPCGYPTAVKDAGQHSPLECAVLVPATIGFAGVISQLRRIVCASPFDSSRGLAASRCSRQVSCRQPINGSR